jgi:uncharacterized membrane protein (TIGR02234 family)
MRRYREFALALLLDALGAGGALLLAVRHWQTVTVPRPAPLHDLTVQVTGRTVDAAPTALALVALAGVVAVLATRGTVRRVVGAVIAAAGAALVWRAVTASSALSAGRARSVVADKRSSADLTGLDVHVVTHPAWWALTVVCGALVLIGGALVAARGHRWQAMSSRYEAPDEERDRARAATTFWTALDRGEDPTE